MFGVTERHLDGSGVQLPLWRSAYLCSPCLSIADTKTTGLLSTWGSFKRTLFKKLRWLFCLNDVLWVWVHGYSWTEHHQQHPEQFCCQKHSFIYNSQTCGVSESGHECLLWASVPASSWSMVPLNLQVTDGPLLFFVALHCVAIPQTDHCLVVWVCLVSGAVDIPWVLSLSFLCRSQGTSMCSWFTKGLSFLPEVS